MFPLSRLCYTAKLSRAMITKQPQWYSCLNSLSAMNLCHRYTDSFHVFRWLHVLDSWVLVNWVLTKYQLVLHLSQQWRRSRRLFFSGRVSPYLYKKLMEIKEIIPYLRYTDLIFLLAKNHFSYSRSMIWQKFFRIFSFLQLITMNSREKTTLQAIFIGQQFLILYVNSKQFWKLWKVWKCWTRQFDDFSVRKGIKRGNI